MRKLFLHTTIVATIFFFTQSDAALLRTLSVGSSGEDVRELQQFLNKDLVTRITSFGPGSPGFETTYFGELTKQAVIRFQEKNKETVLAPLGLMSGTGVVGEKTRNLINANSAGQNNINIPVVPTTPSTPPSPTATNPPINQSTLVRITSITPDKGDNGTIVTITGSGFTDKNTVLIDLDSRYKYVDMKSSANGTKITFSLNTELGKTVNKKMDTLTNKQIEIFKSYFPPFPMPIRVKTEYGISNPLMFTYIVE